ncbi:hypothetical protein [Anaerocolumna xylanovorans]|uniref:Uncharacterized protein n=1 Tax=Anaerocolumna xylanovorans DSM 12503 TaxID=1121345 RepID=A0A1M7XYH8_9FIRM|nr:hypothetical protein [Anaerocolumna xylanovorans]SHO44084.1 hypothetical protein SAMN02745217_00459 [Anaerocolumna xylanovorans DSM 12503]
MEEKEYLMRVIREVGRLLSEVFTSGFISAHEGTIAEMEKLSKTCVQCGLTFAGERLKELAEEIEANRHRMSAEPDRAADIFCSLEQYISLCEKKLALDCMAI